MEIKMNLNPIITSKCTAKSLWQSYSIFSDRLELHTLLGNMVVPFENIEDVQKSESDLKGLLHGNLQLKNFRPSLKLDFANFVEHITIDKTNGMIRRILFTPDNIDEFFNVLNVAMENFRHSK